MNTPGWNTAPPLPPRQQQPENQNKPHRSGKLLTIVPHSVTRSFATCFTATWNYRYEKDPSDNVLKSHYKYYVQIMPPRFDGGTSKHHPDPSPQAYRCAIRNPTAGVYCPKASAAQHRAHLVNLFEGLLFHFDCRWNNLKVSAVFPQQTSLARGQRIAIVY